MIMYHETKLEMKSIQLNRIYKKIVELENG